MPVQVLSRSGTRDAAVGRRTAGGRARRFLRGRGWLKLISLLALVGLWQLLSWRECSRDPSGVARHRRAHRLHPGDDQLADLRDAAGVAARLGRAVGHRALVGVAIAVLLAVVSGLSRIGEYAFDPLLNAARSVPLLGLLPLFIVWFGIGEMPKILFVVLGALFPMYVNTFAGHPRRGPQARRTRPGARAVPVGAGAAHRAARLAPSALTGLRLSVVGSLLALVVASRSTPTPGSAS